MFDTVCSSAPLSSLHSQFSLNFLLFQDLIGYYMRWFVQSAAHSCLLCSPCTASVSLFLHSNIPCMVRFASIRFKQTFEPFSVSFPLSNSLCFSPSLLLLSWTTVAKQQPHLAISTKFGRVEKASNPRKGDFAWSH